MFRGKVRSVHFVGIGGVGMSGIAEVLVNMGFHVTGSDMRAGETVRRLQGLGAEVAIGHAPENIGDADVVVRSTAVGAENVEIATALARNVPVIPRAEMLAELMRMKYGLAVAGSHGKTTTTSMLATVLHDAELDPTIVIGGRLDAIGSNAQLGGGPYLVAEADESDGSFLWLAPTVAVVTNIDPEHLEHYGSFENLVDTFVDFANKVPFYGYTVLCLDHPVVQAMLPRVRRRVLTYGLSAQADVRASELSFEGRESSFVVSRGEERLGEIRLAMPGRHNVSNALAAVATALELDIDFATIARGLDGFTGVQRRFTIRGEVQGRTLIDDYAHHPVEIAATLKAAAQGFVGRRIIAVFQPHRYSRVSSLQDDFCRCFNEADHVVVCPVYAAGERPIEGVDTAALVHGIRAYGHRSVEGVDSLDDAAKHLKDFSREGDLIITLGAGDVPKVLDGLTEALPE